MIPTPTPTTLPDPAPDSGIAYVLVLMADAAAVDGNYVISAGQKFEGGGSGSAVDVKSW